MSLRLWGWNGEREREAAGALSGGWRIARVIGRGQDLYSVTDGDSPRRAASASAEEQLLAANLDTVFLVFALDGGRGFLPRLLERLRTLVRDGGAVPFVLMNKADLAEDPRPYREEARGAAPGVEIVFTSALTGENLDLLRTRLAAGKTYCFLGKSGVGKSSLVNALFGREVMKTAEIRDSDSRGRHTTSSRELLRLPGGALLVDTPGLREAALAEGNLDQRRYDSYLEYRREARHHRLRGDVGAQRLERLRWKGISRLQRNLNRERENGGTDCKYD